MKYYWLIFGVLWIVFNFKTITYAQERLAELASLTNKKLLKFSLITFKWAYLSISALVPPASFGFLGGEIIRTIVIFSWILATFGVLKMLSLSRKSLYFQGLVCAVMTIPLWESLQKLSFKPNNNKIIWKKDLYDIYFEELDKAKRKSNIE